MNQASSTSAADRSPDPAMAVASAPDPAVEREASSNQPQPSYVKLAMRNMVKKRGKSLYHFALTTIGLLLTLVGLAYLTR